MNIKSDTQEWVVGMRPVPTAKVFEIEGLLEITPIGVGDDVWDPSSGNSYTVKSVDKMSEVATMQGGVKIPTHSLVRADQNTLPEYVAMWHLEDDKDVEWLERENNMRLVADLGFRIYWAEGFGMYLGIDKVVNSLFKDYWIPLYKVRFAEQNAEG